MPETDARATSPREIALIVVSMTLITAISLFGLPTSLQSALSLDSAQAGESHGDIDTQSPVFDLAEKASHAVDGAYLAHCDGVAEVPVGDQRGFGIVLERNKKLSRNYASGRGEWDVADLVLVPTGRESAPSVREIGWSSSDPHDRKRPVYMGTGNGFHWYGDLLPTQQDRLRVALELEGGEDRLALLVESIDRSTTRSDRADAIRYIASAMGEEALPILLREINDNLYSSRDYAIHALGTVGGEKSLEILLGLYEEPETKMLARAALSATYSPRAQQAYLDNLKVETAEKPFFMPTIGVVLKHGWTDAIPLLEDIAAAPYTPLYYLEAVAAIRTLKGNPIPDILTTHQATIRDMGSSRDESAAARQALLEHPDTEGAILMAVKLATAEGKGSRLPSETGAAILQALPRDHVLPVLDHLRSTLHDVRARNLLNDIYHSIRGLDMKNIARRNTDTTIG